MVDRYSWSSTELIGIASSSLFIWTLLGAFQNQRANVMPPDGKWTPIAAVVGNFVGAWISLQSEEVDIMMNREPQAKPWSLTGSSGIKTQKMTLVSDAAAFTALLKQHNPYFEPIPTIDFDRFDVVACFAGMQPSGT